MASSQGRQLTLWIDSDRPPVGRLGTPSAVPVPFVGWLDLLVQLAHLLDAALENPDKEQT